jgi:peptidoglycan/LPS O-acetylase OafA/YrhL
MITALRWIMAVTAASLLVAAALHAGLVIQGPFDDAAMYETGVAVVLLIGLALTFIGPAWARWGGLAATVLALAGASIGLYLALRGVGPNTLPDLVYHVALVALLVIGSALRGASRRTGSPSRTDRRISAG